MLFPALATPFDRGRVSADRLVENIARYEAAGIDGYLALGSTGETVLLEAGERRQVLAAVRAAIPAAKTLVAGVLAEATREAVAETRRVADRGADLALVGTPHYFREQMTADALRQHYEAVADASPVPILLYNVPKFTGVPIPISVVASLAGHERVAGMKESSGDAGYLGRVLKYAAPPGFRVFCGAAGLVSAAFAGGASGAILAAAVALPEPFRVRPVPAEALRAAKGIAGDHGVPGLKAAMDHRGLHGGSVRAPLVDVSPSVREEIRGILDDLVDRGVLPSSGLGA